MQAVATLLYIAMKNYTLVLSTLYRVIRLRVRVFLVLVG